MQKISAFREFCDLAVVLPISQPLALLARRLASRCADRYARTIRPVHYSVGGKARSVDRQGDTTKLHMLSTGARRATSAS